MTVPQRISSEGLDDTICLTREGSREVEAVTVSSLVVFLTFDMQCYCAHACIGIHKYKFPVVGLEHNSLGS